MLYLSQPDIDRLGIDTAAVHEAVESVFRQKSLGHAIQKPKLSLNPRSGTVAEALLGVDMAAQASAVKFVTVTTDQPDPQLPNVQALIVLSESHTGQFRSVMNGTWITGVRTAACTAVAARYMASPGATSVGFVGAGLQARANLAALRHVFPGLMQVTAFSRGSSADGFVAHARALGLEAQRATSPREAVEGHDIVVTSVPPSAGLQPYLDPSWVSPGAFVSAVDLGRSWLPEGWGPRFDLICTDDREQSEYRGRQGKMLVPDRFDAEIGELVLGRKAVPEAGARRTALLFAGTALSDLAVAMLVDREARRQGVGVELLV